MGEYLSWPLSTLIGGNFRLVHFQAQLGALDTKAAKAKANDESCSVVVVGRIIKVLMRGAIEANQVQVLGAISF